MKRKEFGSKKEIKKKRKKTEIKKPLSKLKNT